MHKFLKSPRGRTASGAVVLVAAIGVALASMRTGTPGGASPAGAAAPENSTAPGGAGFAGSTWLAGAATLAQPRGKGAASGVYETGQDGSRIVPGEFIVVFEEDALAGYDGSVPGYPRPARAKGKARLDVKGREARNYVSYLQGRQAEHEATIGRALGHQLQVKRRMQHALNAVVANMSNAEAGKVRKMKGVKLVEPVKLEKLNTDVGPWLIGAGDVWNWTGSGAGFPASGEGVVVGILDTGINYASPSFAAVDPFDGYVHKNPLGSGHYLGTCAPGGVDEGHCNDKLIGGYDYIDDFDGDPGFFDNNGHGSHTASTAAGNHRDQMFMFDVRHISGVAPRANIVAFDVCRGGSCPTDAAVAAVNQAIADGVVDVINFSISGGEDPWDESVSLAFLNATDAGIYVATAAGNDGPDPGWIGHVEPWTASTAAAQHGRGNIGFGLQITGPGTVPDSLKAIVANIPPSSVQPTGPIEGPLIVSAGFDTANDGCSGFPADTFKEAIAVVRRAGCPFVDKVNNATAAGAVAVVISNNVDGMVNPLVTGTTVPVLAITKADGDAIRDWAKAHPGATARLASVTFTNKPDVLAEFSSRGPADNYDLITPDLTAPGVDILAAVNGPAEAIGIYSGTSMASPHNAGAAALLRQLHPDWTPAEIKSALALTATTVVYKEDGTTQATPFDMGSGRIRVDKAAQAGLVMNETTANFVAANPRKDGDIPALNLPSIATRTCGNVNGCTFTRTFRSTLPHAQEWTLAVRKFKGGVTPSKFTLNPGESKTVSIHIDNGGLVPDSRFYFGNVMVKPTGNTTLPEMSLPVAIAVPPPAVVLDAPSVDVSVKAGSTGLARFDMVNDGGGTLKFQLNNSPVEQKLHSAPHNTVATAFASNIWSDLSPAGQQAQFGSDNFDLQSETTITSLYTEGFVASRLPLETTASSITWSIFRDGGDQPAGDPLQSPDKAIWSYTAAPATVGITISSPSDRVNSNIRLDLAAAGQNLRLPPGRYWLVVNTTSTYANRWSWFATDSGSADDLYRLLLLPRDGTTWGDYVFHKGLAMDISGRFECGAPWLGMPSPVSGSLKGGERRNVSITVNSAGMAPGTYTAYACFDTTDAKRPKVAEQIRMTVTR